VLSYDLDPPTLAYASECRRAIHIRGIERQRGGGMSHFPRERQWGDPNHTVEFFVEYRKCDEDRSSEAAMGEGGGAQRPALQVSEFKKTGARSARARTRGQTPLVLDIRRHSHQSSLQSNINGYS
jgi:hypothetical protein